MALLTKIEDIISIPLELFHKQKGFHPVDLNRMALRCMERGCRKGIKQVYAPNRFEVALNPDDYEDLRPFLDIVRSDITGELRRVIEERDFLLAGDLAVEITKDKEIPEGLPCVNGYMHGDKDHGSSFSFSDLEEEPEPDDQPFYMDARTVLMVPEPEPETPPEAEDLLEEGISHLREGRVEEAHERLSKAKDELDGLPRYHAALAVALEMLKRRIEALEHYKRLETIEGGKPEVRQRIEWLGRADDIQQIDPRQPAVLGRLELKGTGVVMHIKKDGVFLENKADHPETWVDGRIVSGAFLQDGSDITVGDFEMVFHAGPEIT